MELCIKHAMAHTGMARYGSFNPCFNGTMYKTDLLNENKRYAFKFQSLF